MTWDLKLNPATRDLAPGIVSGVDEIVQRLITRLKRELGEWFLNTSAGLPWHQEGRGMLGARLTARRTIELLVRHEVLGTKGVDRLLRLSTDFPAGTRAYSISLELFITGAGPVSLRIEGEF